MAITVTFNVYGRLHKEPIITKAPTIAIQSPFYVYRGERTTGPFFSNRQHGDFGPSIAYVKERLNLKKGRTYEARGFNSFSFVPWVAISFNAGETCCTYRLKIDPKHPPPMLIIPPFLNPAYSDELEVLLAPSTFKITQVSEITSPLSDHIRTMVYDIEFVKSL